MSLQFLGKLALFSGLSASIVHSSFFTVNPGERCIMFNRTTGLNKIAISEGTHFFLPWLQKPIVIDIKTRPRNLPTSTGTKDLQNVNLTLRILYKPDIHFLSDLFSVYGLDFEDRVLPSVGNEVLKQVVAQYEAAELITKREEVSESINSTLVERLRQFHIVVDDVSITHLTFGAEFTNAIESKQVAEQEAERAKFIVEKDKRETEAIVIRSEGEACAAKLINNALQFGSTLLLLRRIEAAKFIAKSLSQSGKTTYLSSNNNVFLKV
eukprot:TRINITY_DN369_c0_g1_i1.p1 TRINITY_DN369_c0_g1~~TRINITY_DN369_c0_g1_i1.p1  ORF type:complete len:267 (+),score=27.54 TRINITY_DN369_c0_g1_i1:176-976(+)